MLGASRKREMRVQQLNLSALNGAIEFHLGVQ